ncbi:RNA polymerase II elongation factor Ell [Cylas formicarius]|uniref:RNA polymerase II elongation factor Ell n=1 Tax=Cylas formicarius TaxID=197179 RepID=UPI002958430F|nr:RNA polymerase II elongation factor Ell [Cylas formicarius]
MAALCPGVQYGLSSQQNFGEHKDLIFVKLTDSALRAIEDYIKNQNKFAYQNPHIRFLGNENGELSFPSQHHNAGCVSFNFAMSSTADMEGPGGSFECVHGTPPRGPLENLGSIPYKIRVHANEDVYEATRNRMNEVEDKYKNKCTREIKPNQTDIGRKVKVKQMAASRAPPPAQRTASSLPSMRDSLLKHGSAPPSSYQPPPKAPPPQSVTSFQPTTATHSSVSGGGAFSNGLGSNHVSSSQRAAAAVTAATVQHNKKPSVPDVARRPLRERLIQLLALRPLKKIELHDRLTKEGVRGSNSMTTVLKQIAHMKDNCYHLNRNVWNEVNDEWPFYTETEKQVLKRRKPQNLTPPGGSDGGSSGSGQSPTSTHPGSPPLITSSNGAKRPGFHEGADGFPYKRQRIAHGSGNNTKFPAAAGLPAPPADTHPVATYPPRQQQQSEFPAYRQSDQAYSRSPIEQQNSQRRPATDLRDASNMNPRSRESPTTNGYHHLNGYDVSPDDDKKRQQCCDSLTYGVARDKPSSFRNGSPVNNRPPQLTPPNGTLKDKDRRNGGHRVSSSSSSSQRIARVSPDSQTEVLTTDPQSVRPTKLDKVAGATADDFDFPDYKTQYVTITSREQRRRYKADFNADYAEYRDLHGIVDKVSKRFVQLEERLKQEGENSPRYKDIKKQVVREYQENKKDAEHQRAKKRFHYLHEKLSHIKRLVNEYDQTMVGVTDC